MTTVQCTYMHNIKTVWSCPYRTSAEHGLKGLADVLRLVFCSLFQYGLWTSFMSDAYCQSINYFLGFNLRDLCH